MFSAARFKKLSGVVDQLSVRIRHGACRGEKGGEKGSVLVEVAIALPVLLSLVLGLITSGQAYFARISVTEAVREGARFGASLKIGDGLTEATWKSQVRERVVGAAAGQLTAADVCVEFVYPNTASTCGIADPAGAASEPKVHLVKVGATKSTNIEFFFFSLSPSLNAKLAFRYERDTG